MVRVLKNIKQIREIKNLNAYYLADSLKISIRAYYNLESGKSKMTVVQLIEIARLLEVEPGFFFEKDFAQHFVASLKNGLSSKTQEIDLLTQKIAHLEAELARIRAEG